MNTLYRVQNVIFRGRVHPRPVNAVAGDVISVTVTEEHSAFAVWVETAVDDECNEFALIEMFGFDEIAARDNAIEHAVAVKNEKVRVREAA